MQKASLASLAQQLSLQRAEPGKLFLACPARALSIAQRLAPHLSTIAEQVAGKPIALHFVPTESPSTAVPPAPQPVGPRAPTAAAAPAPTGAPSPAASEPGSDLPLDDQPRNHPLVRTVMETLSARVIGVVANGTAPPSAAIGPSLAPGAVSLDDQAT